MAASSRDVEGRNGQVTDTWSVDARPDGIVVLRYTRPQRNFMTFAAMAELDVLLASLAEDAACEVVVLASGLPRDFVAHADLEDLRGLGGDPAGTGDLTKSWYRALRRIEEMPQPVVALVDGQAWGGGLE